MIQLAPIAPYQSWRVQSTDGTWHLVASAIFHYREARNQNQTYCGLTLNNPPFVDLQPLYRSFLEPPIPDPAPACNQCAEDFPKAMAAQARERAAYWDGKVPS